MTKNSISTSALLVVAILCWPARGAPAGDWPAWRGPDGTGASAETDLPVAWSEGSGRAWKCDLPGWGNSTPAIWGDAIFLTSQADERLLLVKISKKARAIEWTREVASAKLATITRPSKSPDMRGTQEFHVTQNMASPSPVTDGQRVIAHYGSGDLACYDFAGNRIWGRNLQKDHGPYTIWWGHASSPVLHGDLVISACLQDSLKDIREKPAESYVVAHDKKTGDEKWKTLRMTGAASEPCDAYTTPLLRRAGKLTELIVVGGTWIDAYDPSEGRQLWCLPGIGGNRTITGPTLAGDMLVTTVGMRGPVLGVKLGEAGPAFQAEIRWKHSEGTPDSPSPVAWGDLVFIVNDGGIATCLDAATGKLQWKQRLDGSYRASPIAAEGRIYFLSMSGLATVIAAGSNFEKLATSEIQDEFIASPAVSDGKIYLRGRKALHVAEKQ